MGSISSSFFVLSGSLLFGSSLCNRRLIITSEVAELRNVPRQSCLDELDHVAYPILKPLYQKWATNCRQRNLLRHPTTSEIEPIATRFLQENSHPRGLPILLFFISGYAIFNIIFSINIIKKQE
jgi:hypothetical protein